MTTLTSKLCQDRQARTAIENLFDSVDDFTERIDKLLKLMTRKSKQQNIVNKCNKTDIQADDNSHNRQEINEDEDEDQQFQLNNSKLKKHNANDDDDDDDDDGSQFVIPLKFVRIVKSQQETKPYYKHLSKYPWLVRYICNETNSYPKPSFRLLNTFIKVHITPTPNRLFIKSIQDEIIDLHQKFIKPI
ncbi:unnamed protein product, partial [Didymodactylos carnosus]